MEITSQSVLAFIYILIGVMLLIVLYHVLFIVVDLRKTMRRVEGLTQQVEEVLLKPISMADQAFNWALSLLEHKKKKAHHHKGFESKEVE